MEGEQKVLQKGTEVSSATLAKVKPGGVDFPSGTPWWAKLAVQVVSMVGVPAAICGFLLWERSTVMKEFTSTNQTMKAFVERMMPVLERLERKVGP